VVLDTRPVAQSAPTHTLSRPRGVPKRAGPREGGCLFHIERSRRAGKRTPSVTSLRPVPPSPAGEGVFPRHHLIKPHSPRPALLDVTIRKTAPRKDHRCTTPAGGLKGPLALPHRFESSAPGDAQSLCTVMCASCWAALCQVGVEPTHAALRAAMGITHAGLCSPDCHRLPALRPSLVEQIH
jgi:hypothetical protein